jgi:integrase
MSKSTRSRRSDKLIKPEKPYPDFPLFAHATKRWCKKILGKLVYFGPWSDPMGALQRYQEQRDDLHAGRVPRARQGGPTVRDLCNQFLNNKKIKMDRQELSPRSFADLHLACERIVGEFGRDRLLSDVTPQDFGKMEAGFPKTWGPIRRGREIQLVRCVFNFAVQQDLVERVRFGDFKKPSRDVLRRHRAKARSKYGLRIFEAKDLRRILDAATQPMRAIVLLGVNAGLGNTDISSLPLSALDLDCGWMNLARQKTGIERRVKLWAETVSALREVIADRPEPKDEADREIVFLTQRRVRWLKVNFEEGADGSIRVSPDDAISKEFRKLLKRLKLKRPGLSFYSLRRNCETIGGESRDQVAVDAVMGHVDSSMGASYRERISDERLAAISDHVRAWLFGESDGA